MASKEKKLQYGQMPIPQGQNSYRVSRINWSGLNRRQTIDTGVLSMENNISTAEAPYLTPSQKRYNLLDSYSSDMFYDEPIAMFGFDGFIVVIYHDSGKIKLDYLVLFEDTSDIKEIYTGVISSKTNEGTPYKQRSMVQFNVYENATNILDGTYVKKLLLFPDKVSMYMNIEMVSENPNTLYEKGNITSLDVMYCYKSGSIKRYYTWNGSEFVQTGGNNYFELNRLDVEVKQYYNDGYRLTKDRTYNDGYKRAVNRYYNDGYKETKYTSFNDGFRRLTSGTYDVESSKVYYERTRENSPYTYIIVTWLEDGASVAGYYEKVINSSYPVAQTTFYKRSGNSYPYEYTIVTGLNYGDDVSNYYEKAYDSQYPITKTVLYRRVENKYPYEYEEATNLKYGDDLSSCYQKVSDKEVETKTYYKRAGTSNEYTYTEVDGLNYGVNVANYYEKTEDYSPPENYSKSCYWKNTFNQDVYCYVKGEGNNDGSFKVSIPPAFPNLQYAAVHLSRLFGVDNDRVHVSGFNDYSNWNLDTVTESNESNAWCSAAQANTKANGTFTGITVYDNHVVCFKHDFMHEIYNNKNPFRLVDVYAEGTIDNRSVQEVDGKLIFVSGDEVKIYTGSNPRGIGYYLGIDYFTAAVSGSDGRNYYLYCRDENNNDYLFLYDTFVGQWSQQTVDFEVINFAHNKNGMFALSDTGVVYKLDTGDYDVAWSFETDMSTAMTASSSTYQTVNIKHIAKIQMLAYISGDFRIYALYDNEAFNPNKSQLLYDNNGKNGMIPIRIKPRMTANYGFKLHFEGYGYSRIYEMELKLTAGGELFV